MSVSTSPKVTVGPGVPEFLRKNGADASFQVVCDTVREWFPNAIAVDVQLEEDHDEPGVWQVVLDVLLPPTLPVETWLDQNRRYHERLAERLSPAQTSLFVKTHAFSAG